MELSLLVVALVLLEFEGGRFLKKYVSPVLAFLCWLKALTVLSAWIAFAGDSSPVRIVIGIVVFVGGVIRLAADFNRKPPRIEVPLLVISPEHTDWRVAHIGVENDGAEINGLDVWKHQWRPVDEHINLPHPQYGLQIHPYSIYEIGDRGHPVRFAAGELSYGVWGFYVPAED